MTCIDFEEQQLGFQSYEQIMSNLNMGRNELTTDSHFLLLSTPKHNSNDVH